MPCVVCFEDSRVLRIVKTSWCENFKNAETKNVGKPSSDLVKIFYSNDKTQKANFDLEELEELDEERSACYIGYVMQVCGKYICHDDYNWRFHLD